MNLEKLMAFCAKLPAPILARPIITRTADHGLTLTLQVAGLMVTLTENGKPHLFWSVDAVRSTLQSMRNIETSWLVTETERGKQPVGDMAMQLADSLAQLRTLLQPSDACAPDDAARERIDVISVAINSLLDSYRDVTATFYDHAGARGSNGQARLNAKIR